MKTIIVTLSIFLMSTKLFSQNVWWEINFDDTNNMSRVFIDTSLQNNIWQIGIPQKLSFNSSFSFPKAIVTDNISYQISTSIEEKNSLFKIFPNPTNQSFTIITQEKMKKIMIENTAGKIVKEINGAKPPIFINIEDFTSGIYFVRMFSEQNNFVTTKKLIKR